MYVYVLSTLAPLAYTDRRSTRQRTESKI